MIALFWTKEYCIRCLAHIAKQIILLDVWTKEERKMWQAELDKAMHKIDTEDK